MQDNVSIATKEKDLNVKYGMYNLCPEREAARGSLKYILSDMNDIRKSFIRLGFHLAEMQRNKYYEDFGYLSLEEFAEANLGMDKSNVYRYIRVYENFALPCKPILGSSLSSVSSKMFLDDKWKDYSFSQLVEMCSMSKFQRQACRPDMTIKQIREVKKTVPKNAHPIFDSSKELASMNKVQQDQTEKVAMSPQKKEDKSKDFSYTYCSGLRGAARAAYVKSRKSICNAEISIYDSEGKMVDFLFEPPAFNTMLDVLCCENGRYVFRLKGVWKSYSDESVVESEAVGQVSQDPQLS